MHKFLLGAALVLLSFPASAQTVEQDGANDQYGLKTEFAERVFLKYHRAIHAEEACNDRSFSPQDRLSMEQIIAGRMSANSPEVAVGAARLRTLRGVADDQMDDMIDKEDCTGADVQKALHFFDEHLASVSPPPAEPPQSLTKSDQ